MTELSAEEKDLLNRVREKPELATLFFRRVKGVKWFDAFEEAGYFAPEHFPKPVPAKQEGYFTIARWEIGEYLVKTAALLADEEQSKFAPRLVEIISRITAHAIAEKISNYHAWWQMVQILAHIRTEFIGEQVLDEIDYWLDDRFDRNLVVDELAAWLQKLLNETNEHASQLAVGVINAIYKVEFVDKKFGESVLHEAKFRMDFFHADKITRQVAQLAGRQLTSKAVEIFSSRLSSILKEIKNDNWSSVWHPAIEDHEQNKHREEPENTLIVGFRNSLQGFFEKDPTAAARYVETMLGSEWQTVQRIAIHSIAEHFDACKGIAGRLITEDFLKSNFRHELWRLLNLNYASFPPDQKATLLSLIEHKVAVDEGGARRDGASAYEQATWLSAIKAFGDTEQALYDSAVKVAKAEPEHPDFASFMTSGWVAQRSPYSKEELSSASVDELVLKLEKARAQPVDFESNVGLEGLARTLKEVVKSAPLTYYAVLPKFVSVDLAFVHGILDSYTELWIEKSPLPWDDLWGALLSFCKSIIDNDVFWNPANAAERPEFVANQNWIVSAIARMLEAGLKSDEHAIDEKFNSQIESIVLKLLNKAQGRTFEVGGDAMSIAINSPRGHCLEAFFNLALRCCRLADRDKRERSSAWSKFENYFQLELAHPESPEKEFHTLVASHLPNFLYMSKKWVTENLKRIFDHDHYLAWICAMQGYSYVGHVYEVIYVHLKLCGDLRKALDDPNVKKKVEDRFVQHIAVAYLQDMEDLADDSSLIRAVVDRKVPQELRQLIWFLWNCRKEGDAATTAKVFAIWTRILATLEFTKVEDRQIASSLTLWADFVDELNDQSKRLLTAVAAYAEESHNSYQLLKSIARLSARYPLDVGEIWRQILRGAALDHPEEAIRQILTALVMQGNEGRRLAREIVSEYLKRGMDRPVRWLKEIVGPSA